MTHDWRKFTLPFASAAAFSLSAGTASIGAAQEATVTPYVFITPLIEAAVTPHLQAAGVEWGDPPHVTMGPLDDGYQPQFLIHLNLKSEQPIVGTVKAGVDLTGMIQCIDEKVDGMISLKDFSTDLPGWVEDLFASDVNIPTAALEPTLDLAVQQLVDGRCGDARTWADGIYVFPPDALDPMQPSPTISNCKDSTSGRSGQVYIDNGLVYAEIHPGTNPYWPEEKARLRIWVSPDANESNAFFLEESRFDRKMQEPVATQGHRDTYALPPGVQFVGCDIDYW